MGPGLSMAVLLVTPPFQHKSRYTTTSICQSNGPPLWEPLPYATSQLPPLAVLLEVGACLNCDSVGMPPPPNCMCSLWPHPQTWFMTLNAGSSSALFISAQDKRKSLLYYSGCVRLFTQQREITSLGNWTRNGRPVSCVIIINTVQLTTVC